MENPIHRHGLFATPDSFDGIDKMINGLSGNDRMHGYTIAMMTWNLASKVVEEAIAADKQERKVK